MKMTLPMTDPLKQIAEEYAEYLAAKRNLERGAVGSTIAPAITPRVK